MGPPQSRLPRSIIAAFLVLCGLAVWVTLRRRPPADEPVPTPAPPPAIPHAPPDRAVLRETRREGSRFHCTVTGRLQGTLKQTTSLEIYHPIFRGDIRSAWLAPWTTRFTAEVLRNDGVTIQERRTFHEARCVELVAPAELTDLTYDLDPRINQAVVRLASRLQQLHPGNVFSRAMGAVIRSQEFNYAEVARLTGIDERLLQGQQATVAGAARILDDFEGKTVEVAIRDGRAQWIYAPDLPPLVSDALGRVNTLIDYSALPSPALAVGEQTVLSNLVLNEMIPPVLMDELLGDFDTDLSLNLTRRDDVTRDAQRWNRFEGDGRLTLQRADGNVSARLVVRSASLDVNVTDPANRFVSRLEIRLPVESSILARQSRFRRVAWDGDLELHVVYAVELE